MPTGLDLATCDKLLTTTRSVRMRLDFTRPIEPELIEQCIAIALQSPSSTNTQLWRFIVITEADKRAAVANVYREMFEQYWAESVAASPEAYASPTPGVQRMINSAQHLAAHMQEAPVLVLFCIEEDLLNAPLFQQAGGYGSILPAAWSFMLAARARGLGCCWTTVHLRNAEAAAQTLGLPDGVTQTVLLPVAYYKGDDFKAAPRIPAKEVTYWNSWGNRR